MKCQRKDGHYFNYNAKTANTALIASFINRRVESGAYIITLDGNFIPVGNGDFHYNGINQYLMYYLNDLTIYHNCDINYGIKRLNQEGMIYTFLNLDQDYQGNRIFCFPALEDQEKMTPACKEAAKTYIQRCKQWENRTFRFIYGNLAKNLYYSYEEIMELLDQEKSVKNEEFVYRF